jgi:hypothetical protein
VIDLDIGKPWAQGIERLLHAFRDLKCVAPGELFDDE